MIDLPASRTTGAGSKGRLAHLCGLNGEKTEFQEGEWFRIGGTVYTIHDGELVEVPSSMILAYMLDPEG